DTTRRLLAACLPGVDLAAKNYEMLHSTESDLLEEIYRYVMDNHSLNTITLKRLDFNALIGSKCRNDRAAKKRKGEWLVTGNTTERSAKSATAKE
ncbi:unnamed protein product, partial [Didymodactylos carnosus]